MKLRAIAVAGIATAAFLGAAVPAYAGPDDQTTPDDQAGNNGQVVTPEQPANNEQPVNNEPAVPNPQFLRKVRTDGIHGTDDSLMRDGHDACQQVRDGKNGPQTAEYFALNRGLDVEDSNQFVLDAVRYLCPEYLAPLTGS